MTEEEHKKFEFTWYHWEEWQVIFVILCLVVFFSRTIWLSIGLIFSILFSFFVLYLFRVIEAFLGARSLYPKLLQRYREFKNVLHGHSIERSRIAMAILASTVILVLLVYRIDLASTDPADATPTDIYWILFLSWYALVCTVSTAYLSWLWRNWVRHLSVRIPLMDGMVASLFFFHGLNKKERLVTYVATFFFGGVPSFFALRLSTDTPFDYTIACLLIVPVALLTLGGAYYAKHYLLKSANNANLQDQRQ
jgi:hypothetical protein